MNLGVMVEGQEGLDWELWRRIARTTEELGFESLWRSDHLFSLAGARSQDALEPFVSFALLAAETERIRFGPLVTSVTFRHPSMVARMAAQIDQLSGGRFVLGMGAGWNVDEHEAFGIRFPPARERLDRLAEAVQIVQALWGDGPASFEGRHYRLHEAECYPKPVQQPLPVLVGGNGERRTLRIVAEHANEWNAIALSPDAYLAKREVLERHCAEVGRDPQEIGRSMMVGYLVATDDAALRDRVHALTAVDHPSVMGFADADEALAKLRRRSWLVGTPGEIVDRIGRYEDAGIDRIMLHHLNMQDFDSLELLAADVLPQVQR